MIPTSIDGTDITGATIDGQDVQEITVDGQTVFSAGPFKAPVNRLYVADFSAGVKQFDLPNPFDLTGKTQTGTLDGSASGGTGAYGCGISQDGLNFYLSDHGDDHHEYYTLGTAYDITTATFQGVQVDSGPGLSAESVTISPDGVDSIIINGSTDKVSYYTLSTPFDITTRTLVDEFDAGSNTYDSQYIDGGAKVASAYDDGSSTSIYVWELTTPYDFSTRTNRQEYTGFADNSRGMAFSNDGTKLFTASYTDDRVIEFSLSTPYDASSSSRTEEDSFAEGNAIGLEVV